MRREGEGGREVALGLVDDGNLLLVVGCGCSNVALQYETYHVLCSGNIIVLLMCS